MRTTLNLDKELFKEASLRTGIKQKTELIHSGLKALLREEACKRLAQLGGAIKKAKAVRRRRF